MPILRNEKIRFTTTFFISVIHDRQHTKFLLVTGTESSVDLIILFLICHLDFEQCMIRWESIELQKKFKADLSKSKQVIHDKWDKFTGFTVLHLLNGLQIKFHSQLQQSLPKPMMCQLLLKVGCVILVDVFSLHCPYFLATFWWKEESLSTKNHQGWVQVMNTIKPQFKSNSTWISSISLLATLSNQFLRIDINWNKHRYSFSVKHAPLNLSRSLILYWKFHFEAWSWTPK